MASTVINANSADWSLVGAIGLTTRTAIARWCPPAAGTENDPILLTNNATTELAQPTLRFRAAAIIVYGAIIGDLDGAIARGVDGGATGGAIPAADIAAAESHSANAACGLVLARANNLETGVQHTFDINPLGKVDFAIYRVELFQEPIVTTRPAPASSPSLSTTSDASSTTPSTTSDASSTISGTTSDSSRASSFNPSTTSSETTKPASSIGTIKSPSPSSTPIAAIIVPIVIGVLVLLGLAIFFLWRRRRRPAPPDSTISTYDSAAQLKRMSHANIPTTATGGKGGLSYSDDARPYAVASQPPSDDPYARADEKVRLLHVSDAKNWQRQGQSSKSGSGAISSGLSTPAVDLIVPGSSGARPQGQDAAQMAALSEAMQRAGFSPAALLESLNRVHARADDDIVAATPTETRTRPPQYRE